MSNWRLLALPAVTLPLAVFVLTGSATVRTVFVAVMAVLIVAVFVADKIVGGTSTVEAYEDAKRRRLEAESLRKDTPE